MCSRTAPRFLLVSAVLLAMASLAAGPAPAGDGPLPEGAIFRFGTRLFRHDGTVTGLAFTPDRKALISSSADQTVRFWDLATGKELRRLELRDLVLCLALSPDGRLLATGEARPLVSWGRRPRLRLWDMATGKELPRLPAEWWGIQAVRFSPDGKTVASAAEDDRVKLWEVSTGKELRAFRIGNTGWGHETVFSANLRVVAVGGGLDNTLRRWEVKSGKELPLIVGSLFIASLALSPDGKQVASAGAEGLEGVRLWETATGKEVRTLEDRFWPRAMAYSPDGKSLAGASAKGLRLWDVRTGQQLGRAGGLDCGAAVAFSRDGKLLAAGGDHLITVWELGAGKVGRPLAVHGGRVSAAAFSPGGTLIALGRGDQSVQLWDTATWRPRRTLGSSGARVDGLAFSADGKALFAADSGGTIRAWQVADGKEARPPVHTPPTNRASVLSEDGRFRVEAGSDEAIRIWSAATGKELRTLRAPGEGELALAISRDGRVVAAARPDGPVLLWDVRTGKELRPCGPVKADHVALSPDGKLLASRSDYQPVRLWDVATGKELRALDRTSGWSGPLRFSPDGRLLAGQPETRLADLARDRRNADAYSLCLWEVASGAEVRRFRGHSAPVQGITFAPLGRRVLSLDRDGTALVWGVTGPHGQGGRVQPDALWADLASKDAGRAYHAVWALAADDNQALPLLRARLRPATGPGPGLRRLLADLDSEDFEARQRATAELEKLGEAATPALRQALEGKPGPAARRRLERLLEKALAHKPAPETLGALRALAVLEYLDTPDARRLLRALAEGDPDALLTREAKAALQRVARRRGTS
jgi:WD40 repeat protein